MFLYANGGENTYGRGLGLDEKTGEIDHVYRQNNTWATKLAAKMNATAFHNDAVIGTSNANIAVTTMDWINRNYLLVDKPVDDLFVAIEWVTPTNYESNLSTGERTTFTHSDLTRLGEETGIIPDDLGGLFEERVGVMNLALQALALQGFLTSHGIRYVFFNSHRIKTPIAFDETQSLMTVMNADNYPSIIDSKKNMTDILGWVNKDITTAEGHEFWAKFLVSYLSRKDNPGRQKTGRDADSVRFKRYVLGKIKASDETNA